MSKIRFMQGNEAMAEGAIAAGARFFAGYPITPSSEVAEAASRRLPQVGGIYIQMEDELASMTAVIAASLSGRKSFTATSGPGFSLMQENVGFACMAETPCVIIDVQRSGPSTGVATKPAQGDIMQARWGTHGDHSLIAVAPSSVQDCFDITVKAFNMAEKYRTPVIVLADETIGHLKERIEIPDAQDVEVIDRELYTGAPEDFRPYGTDPAVIPPTSYYGGPYIFRGTATMHSPEGKDFVGYERTSEYTRYLYEKIESRVDEIAITRKYFMDDADIVIISFGASARAGLAAVEEGRAMGKKIGMLQLVTIWPFPKKEVMEAMEKASLVVVPEMNLGQLRGELEKYTCDKEKLIGVNKVNTRPVTPLEILAAIEKEGK